MKDKRQGTGDILGDFDNLSAEEMAKLLSETILPTIELPALQRGLETLREGLDKFGNWAAKIDWSAFIDGRGQQHLVTRVAEEALARDDLSESERHRISGDFEEFRTDFAEIIQSREACNKEIVLRVVLRAMFIGYAAGVPADRVHELREKVENVRRSIKKANNARRADDVQAIIDRQVEDRGAQKPSDTARAIRVSAMEEEKKRKETADKALVERIRKRLRPDRSSG